LSVMQTQTKCVVLFVSVIILCVYGTTDIRGIGLNTLSKKKKKHPQKPVAGRADTAECCLTIQEDKRNFKVDMICMSKKTNKQKRTEKKCQSKPENIVAIDPAALTVFSRENV